MKRNFHKRRDGSDWISISLLRGYLCKFFHGSWVYGLAIALMLSWPANAADPLGIDCDKPRYTTGGKLIPDFDNAYRTKCETDRATALNYALVVSSTRDALRKVLRSVPQPLWDHLVKHLHETDPDERDSIHDWVFPNTDSDLALIMTSNNTIHLNNVYHWHSGIMDKTAAGNVWHSLVQARACGVTLDSGRPEIDSFSGAVLTWLDPDNIRDRWTAQMIQRTVRAHMEGRDGYGAMAEQVPDVLTSNRQLVDAQGQVRANSSTLRACLDKEPAIPSGSLIMQIPLRYEIETEYESLACTDSYKVGSMTLEYARHNGIYIVPMNAIRADGTPHPQRGKPLLREFTDPADRPVRVKFTVDENGQFTSNRPIVLDPAPISPVVYPNLFGSSHSALFLTKACREPDVRDYVQTKSCDSTINGNPVKGSVIRTFRFREFQDDPTNLNRVYLKAVKRDPGNTENPLGVPLAEDETAHLLWNETTLFCPDIPDPELPLISEPVVFTEGIKTCKEQWGASYEGTRTGYVRKVVYPEGWPVRQTESEYIDDDCFMPVPNRGIENGTDVCQAGYEGSITKTREVSWLNRLWAVTDNYYPGFGRRMPMPAGIQDAIAQVNTDQTGLNWYDRATAGGWSITSDSCRKICPAGYERALFNDDTGTTREFCQIICPFGYYRVNSITCQRILSNSHESQNQETYDTDGDGYTDSSSPNPDGSHFGSANNSFGSGSSASGPGNQGSNSNDDS